MQRVIKRCVDAEVDVAAYDRNRNLLYNSLKDYGFDCIKPEGAFYLFVKSPVENEKEFCETAKQYNVLVVREVPLPVRVSEDCILCFVR